MDISPPQHLAGKESERTSSICSSCALAWTPATAAQSSLATCNRISMSAYKGAGKCFLHSWKESRTGYEWPPVMSLTCPKCHVNYINNISSISKMTCCSDSPLIFLILSFLFLSTGFTSSISLINVFTRVRLPFLYVLSCRFKNHASWCLSEFLNCRILINFEWSMN